MFELHTHTKTTTIYSRREIEKEYTALLIVCVHLGMYSPEEGHTLLAVANSSCVFRVDTHSMRNKDPHPSLRSSDGAQDRQDEGAHRTGLPS